VVSSAGGDDYAHTQRPQLARARLELAAEPIRDPERFIPLLYASITYGIVWCARLGGFPNHEFMELRAQLMGLRASPVVSTVLYILLAGSFGLAKSLASALGGEIGWRGFLVPEHFKNIGFTGT
jgi:hypothetical protein